MHDIPVPDVFLPVHNDTCTTHVTTACDHAKITSVELDKMGDFSLLNVELDGIVDFDEGIGVTDGTSIVGDNVRNIASTDRDLLNLEELICGLLGDYTVNGKSTFDVV